MNYKNEHGYILLYQNCLIDYFTLIYSRVKTIMGYVKIHQEIQFGKGGR